MLARHADVELMPLDRCNFHATLTPIGLSLPHNMCVATGRRCRGFIQRDRASCAMTTTIHHVPEIRRFTTSVDGHEGYVQYSQHGDTLSIDHTIVPSAIGGRGIASDLVKAAVEFARNEGLKVHPACTYADAWMRRHHEYDALRV